MDALTGFGLFAVTAIRLVEAIWAVVALRRWWVVAAGS